MNRLAQYGRISIKALVVGIKKGVKCETIVLIRVVRRQQESTAQFLSLGQASRIAGVTPADLSVLMVYLKAGGRRAA